MAWHNSATPYETPAGENYARPMTLVIEPNGGTVQVQFRDSAGAWTTPTSGDYTLTEAGPVRVERSNTPPMRIAATGGAKFEVTL